MLGHRLRAVPAGSNEVELEIINPSADIDLSGWTTTAGTLMRHSGSHHFMGKSSSLYAHQDIEIPAVLIADVDASMTSAELSWNFGGWSGDSDKGECGLTLLDASGSEIATVWSGLVSRSGPPSSYPPDLLTSPLPVGCRKIRIRMHGVRSSGTYLDAYWDDFRLSISTS